MEFDEELHLQTRTTPELLAIVSDDRKRLAVTRHQRLIKAKALLDKSLASPKPSGPVASGNPPASNVPPAQPATNANSEQLTGMNKVEYNALIVLTRQAQQITDLSEQKKGSNTEKNSTFQNLRR
jgi:hypothetical protein